MKNCPEYLIVQCGVWYAGAAVVPINAKLHGCEAAWIIENTGASLALVTGHLRAAVVCCDVVDVVAQDFGRVALAPVGRGEADLWRGCFTPAATPGAPRA